MGVRPGHYDLCPKAETRFCHNRQKAHDGQSTAWSTEDDQAANRDRILISLADSPVLSEASIRLDKNSLGLQRTALLSSHLRYAPVSIMPL